MSKILIIAGILLVALGLLLPVLQKLRLGRLPGDIFIQREDFQLYFPITTCLLVSVLLGLLYWIYKKYM